MALPQVVQECTVYHRHVLGRMLYIMLTILTGGLFAIALQVAPAPWRAAHFLRKCPLHDASIVLVRASHQSQSLLNHLWDSCCCA